MTKKWPLIGGVALLSLGIIFRFAGMESYIYFPLLAAGGILKIIYITNLLRNKIYKPGFEILFLVIGLLLFFSGIILKYQAIPSYIYFLLPGLMLKLLFVVLLFRKAKSNT